MQAIGLSRWTGANNVANMNTPGIRASLLTLETGPEEQDVNPQSFDRGASPSTMVPVLGEDVDEKYLQGTSRRVTEGSNTDVAMELVNSTQDVRALWAKAVMVRTWVEDETTVMVLDLHA